MKKSIDKRGGKRGRVMNGVEYEEIGWVDICHIFHRTVEREYFPPVFPWVFY